LHAPLLDSTYHLINRDSLARMKPGAVLINTGRGELVDSDALLEALEDGRLAAAGLDVLDGEAMLREDAPRAAGAVQYQLGYIGRRLASHPRVIFTPHTAFNTVEAVERILATTVANVEAFQRGEPQNLVRQAS